MPGDCVDIIAPGSGTSPREVRAAVAYLQSLDLRPRVSKSIMGREKLFANSDDFRFQDLKKALLSEDSKGVWCLRGGYGALRLLPQLAKLRRPRTSKLFMGYSDITSLHLFLNQFWNWPSLHSPNLDRFAQLKDSFKDQKELEAIIFGKKSELEFNSLKPLNSAAERVYRIKASVAGGNLCVLQSSLGTPWQISGNNKILFFEDRGEAAHRVDRMLEQMNQAGIFKKVKAVVFGDLQFDRPENEKMIWQDVIPRFAKAAGFPVLKGLPAGHGQRQRLIPFFTKAELRLGKKAKLNIQSGSIK